MPVTLLTNFRIWDTNPSGIALSEHWTSERIFGTLLQKNLKSFDIFMILQKWCMLGEQVKYGLSYIATPWWIINII